MDKRRAVKLKRSHEVFRMRFDGVKNGYKWAKIIGLDDNTNVAQIIYPEAPPNPEYPFVRYPLHAIEELDPPQKLVSRRTRNALSGVEQEGAVGEASDTKIISRRTK